MIRFERPTVELSKKKKRWRLLLFLFGIGLLIGTIFFSSRGLPRSLNTIIFSIYLISTYFPFQPKKQMPFVEIDDQQIRWNNNEEYRGGPDPDVLSWSEINRVKRLANNELMFFVENSFYRRLWLNHYPADQQQIIIDTIKAYGERFSLRWVEEQKEAAVA
jgi:hypothetical protein